MSKETNPDPIVTVNSLLAVMEAFNGFATTVNDRLKKHNEFIAVIETTLVDINSGLASLYDLSKALKERLESLETKQAGDSIRSTNWTDPGDN